MQEYADKAALMQEISKTAALFIDEFKTIDDAQRDCLFDSVDRTPAQMIAYQLGWMALLRTWDSEELAGAKPQMPAPGFKWNQLGGLYQAFYQQYQDRTLTQLCELFVIEVHALLEWLQTFSEDELFKAGARKWADSTPSAWLVWKWVHINTVSPFKSFRSKVRKWKKLRDLQNT